MGHNGCLIPRSGRTFIVGLETKFLTPTSAAFSLCEGVARVTLYYRYTKPKARIVKKLRKPCDYSPMERKNHCGIFMVGQLHSYVIRIETAKEWINQTLIGLESPIPFPSIPFPKFAQWLLIDWWNVHGISLYAQELYHAHNSELLTCWHKSCCIYECGFDSFCKFSLQ